MGGTGQTLRSCRRPHRMECYEPSGEVRPLWASLPSARSWEVAAHGPSPVLLENQLCTACRQLGTGSKKTIYLSKGNGIESSF